MLHHKTAQWNFHSHSLCNIAMFRSCSNLGFTYSLAIYKLMVIGYNLVTVPNRTAKREVYLQVLRYPNMTAFTPAELMLSCLSKVSTG